MEYQFRLTKELYCKVDGVQYHHIIQSFSPRDNLTFDKAHKLGMELADKCFERFEVLVITHKDKQHIHNHLVVNSVSFVDGKKYNSSNKSLWDIKRESNKICYREHLELLNLNKKAEKRITTAEYRIEKRGKETWKSELRDVIELELRNSRNLEEFRRNLKEKYEVETRVTRSTISYKHPNCNKSIRGNKLGAEYVKEYIENELSKQANRENRERNETARRNRYSKETDK